MVSLVIGSWRSRSRSPNDERKATSPQRVHGVSRSRDQTVTDEDRAVQIEQDAFDVFERLRHSVSRSASRSVTRFVTRFVPKV